MSIFLAFLQSKVNHPIPSYSFWEYYIKNGIEEAGYSWIEADVDWAEGLLPLTEEQRASWRAKTWAKTVAYIKKNRPSVFLSYLYPQQIDVDAIQEIQKLGIPCVNFFCDNIRLFESVPAEFKVFDLNWVPEFKAIKLYQKSKLPHLNLPMPMWVEKKYRTIATENINQVTFIGSRDLQRALFFDKVITLDPNINLGIYGGAWDNREFLAVSTNLDSSNSYANKIKAQFASIKFDGFKGYLRKLQQRNLKFEIEKLLPYFKGIPTFESYIDLTKNSKITLGINRYPSFRHPLHAPNSYSRLRDIEAPMLGACYLTEFTEGLDLLYDLGKEIETYNSAFELLEKIKELELNQEKRAKMRILSQQKALQKNSIPNSLNQIQCFLKV